MNRVEEMIPEQRCSKCKTLMKRIPIKKLDSTFIIEYYCDACDESVTFFPDLDIVKLEQPKVF